MALPSDENGADSRLAVTFYKRSMKQEDESMAAGRPIFKEFDFVRICVPGDNLTEIDTYARDSHKSRFPRQWMHYQNQVGTQESIIGTPIEEWTIISRSQADELKGIKFATVESVANCSDQQLQRIGMIAGMSPFAFRDSSSACPCVVTSVHVGIHQHSGYLTRARPVSSIRIWPGALRPASGKAPRLPR